MSPEVGELDTAAVRDAVADDPDDVLPLLMQMSTATDPALRAKVQALVPRLVLERARSGTRGGSGAGRLRRSPADRGGDLDVDASMEAIGQARGEQRPPGLEELTATTWHRPRTALCLLLDRSGSMDGSRLVTAAMAAAACALRAEGELSVIAFDRTPEVLLDLHAPSPPLRTVQRVLGLRGHGMTSMDAAFRAAADQLRGARATRRITIVLSDCRATDEVDAVPAARALEELVVIAPASDDEEARRVAREAGARIAAIESVDDLPRLLDQLLGR
ncbi:vWA domain-containing protein [Nocardioides aurantiacus]|uniref:Mg-chelatase subunit ChlD n=1 Tax=Nocardioides aurantiacus TaxID=86796 RepID=A0A3N2CQF9_9ACTN|nr:vWA domain-containing protein [Nocardioides aurantiacus]ROR89762.1 Mg-chelatase subunit ChlD [Nocardioides aurantiacus]